MNAYEVSLKHTIEHRLLDINDYYGNISSAYTSGYFTLGNPNEDQYNMEQIVTQTEGTSNSFVGSMSTLNTL